MIVKGGGMRQHRRLRLPILFQTSPLRHVDLDVFLSLLIFIHAGDASLDDIQCEIDLVTPSRELLQRQPSSKKVSQQRNILGAQPNVRNSMREGMGNA